MNRAGRSLRVYHQDGVGGATSWLVLMASPRAVRSKWVNCEVAWWLENKSPQRLLVVLTEGEFVYADDAADGATRGIVWVPAQDPASLNFYQRAGWDPLSLTLT
ncbi:MAG: hypothetical protein JO272_10640 [Pseudonocardiales bacterium]|nr:hypothetical protein [Pseudonocardiales bacterium]